jgi:Flp pilus assembly protein TadD
VFHDSLALWSDTAQKNPLSADAAIDLGSALFQAGRFSESVASCRRAIDLTGGKMADPFAEMAVALDALGRKSEADAVFKQAMTLDKRYANPALLVKALTWERRDAEKLQIIADRN